MAVPPAGRCQAAWYTHTRWPIRAGSTPAPTAEITPAPSWFGVCSTPVVMVRLLPARVFQSVGFTPDTRMATTTSPAAGSGTGRSTSRSTVELPFRSWTMARIPGLSHPGRADVRSGSHFRVNHI